MVWYRAYLQVLLNRRKLSGTSLKYDFPMHRAWREGCDTPQARRSFCDYHDYQDGEAMVGLAIRGLL